MADFTLKVGDTRPNIVINLKNPDGSAVNLLTASSVTLRLRFGQLLLTRTCSITDPANGVVQYNWIVGDTSIEGSYAGDVRVLWNDGTQQTFPNTGFFGLAMLGD